MSHLDKQIPTSLYTDTRPTHEDLRDLLVDFERMGELVKVDGAESHLELSALAETVTARYPGAEPALLFDNIPGYPKGFRVLSGAANSYKRLAHVFGFPEPRGRMDIVRAYKARMKHTFEMTPPRIVSTGPVLENIWRDDEVASGEAVGARVLRRAGLAFRGARSGAVLSVGSVGCETFWCGGHIFYLST